MISIVMRLRNLLYDWGALKVHRVNIPVISVGNIVLGGSGKTPVTLALAELLGKTKKVAIVSRGYRGRAEKGAHPQIVKGDDWELYGDEPCLLAKRLPHAMVIVGRDRVAGARLAEKEGAEVILLDDGMQHRRLHRDYEIVVVAHDLSKKILREPISGLKRADLIIANGCNVSYPGPIVKTRYRANANLQGKRVAIFCGIANPKRFRKTVESLGATVVHHRYLRDHGLMKDLDSFIQKSREKGAEEIVCTEKDWVKYDAPITSIPIDLEIIEGEAHWKKIVELA